MRSASHIWPAVALVLVVTAAVCTPVDYLDGDSDDPDGAIVIEIPQGGGIETAAGGLDSSVLFDPALLLLLPDLIPSRSRGLSRTLPALVGREVFSALRSSPSP